MMEQPKLCLQALGKIAGTSLLQRNLVRNLPVRAKSTKAFKLSPNGHIVAPLLGSIKRIENLCIWS